MNTTSVPPSFSNIVAMLVKNVVIASIVFFIFPIAAVYSAANEHVTPTQPQFIEDDLFDPDEAEKKLSKEMKGSFDIQFFNDFWAKNEFPTQGRVIRIRELARKGFETAYLANRLFAFERGGIPRFGRNYQADWNRLRILAESGDTSAQCLFASAAIEYRSFNLSPPTEEELKMLVPKYRGAAISKQHPYCWWIWGRMNGGPDEGQLTLQCARSGATYCQQSLSILYRQGTLLPRNPEKGLCWLMKAQEENEAPSIKSWLMVYTSLVTKEIGNERVEQVLNEVTKGVDCESLRTE